MFTWARAFLPSPTWLRLGIVPVLAFLATITDRNYLADFWHHLARGRAIVEQRQIVNHDIFTFTVANKPLQDVNWLTQVGYHVLFDGGGLPLVQFVNSLVIALTFLLVVLACRRRAGALMPGVIAAGIAFFCIWEVLTIRPQTLSLLLFVVMLEILRRSESRPWLLVAPPLLMVPWANLHGAFPLGIILVGCFTFAAVLRWAAGWRWLQAKVGVPESATNGQTNQPRLGLETVMPLTACLAACVLASFVNPYGWEVYQYVRATSAVAYERQIAEWVRPGPDRLIGLVWMGSVAAVVGLAAWRWRSTRRLPALPDALMLGCFFALSLGSVRMVPWWMLVSAPVLAELLAWWSPRLGAVDLTPEQPSLAAGGVFGCVTLAVLFSLPGLDRYNPLLGPTRRGQRVEEDIQALQKYLQENARPGNIYSHFEWGEYMSWCAVPPHRIIMDGRIELYPNDVWLKYNQVTFGFPDWQKILDEYAVDYLILDGHYHAKTGLLATVHHSPHWRLVCQSRAALLYVRSGAHPE